ncbi:haloacid dehalogenase type II [Alteromonadaceae bacterium M269]|nr:haloacid dehalogenase type II [Alteromonadaceae bacterium M269]
MHQVLANDAQPDLPKPKLIIFDVNETLLDLGPLRKAVGQTIDGREELLPLWFSTMLHYSLVDTLTNDYRDFGQIGAAALIMVAKNQGIAVSEQEAKKAIIGNITKLPAHADVKSGLRRLSSKGFRIVSLTNSSNKGVAAQFKYTALTPFFEKRFSVEDVKAFKPHPRPYQWVLDEMGIKPNEALMVAAHAWDLAGAKSVGLQTAFIQRPNTTLYPNAPRPDYVVDDLLQLTELLIKE